MVWDVRQKHDPVSRIEAVDSETKRDCWTVAFGNSYNSEQRVVCAGYDNGDVKMFDLRTNTVRWEANVKNGVFTENVTGEMHIHVILFKFH